MTTWHQQKAMPQLWHETKHTVVSDPPGGTASVARFDTPEQAQSYIDNLNKHGNGKHSYILPPQNDRLSANNRPSK